MKAEHFKKFELKITKAIKAHLDKGGKLTTGTFTIRDNTMCPLVCLIQQSKDKVKNYIGFDEQVAVALKLPFTYQDMQKFYLGFDNPSTTTSRSNLTVLGRKLRAKYLPIESPETLENRLRVVYGIAPITKCPNREGAYSS